MIPKLLVVTLFSLGFFTYCFGQDALPRELSLEQAKDLALENNPQLKVQSVHQKISMKEVELAQKQRIPDLYANFDLRRNLITATTPVPAIAFDPSADPKEIRPLKFMTDWNSNTGLNARFDLFNPANHGNIKEAQLQADLSQIDREITAVEITFQVEMDYAACLIAREQLQLALSDTLNKHELLTNSLERFRLGEIKATEVNEAKIIKKEALTTYYEALEIDRNAQAQLLFDIGLKAENGFSLTFADTLEKLVAKDVETGIDATSLTLTRWEKQKDLTGQQLRNKQLEFLPTLSLNGFYGANYFSNRFDFFKDRNWFGNSYFGLSVQVPITAGFSRAKEVQILNFQQELNQLNKHIDEAEQDLQSEKLSQEILSKQKRLQLKEKTRDLQQQNLDLAQEQLESGRITTNDWLVQNQIALQAKTAYLQAAYDLIKAKIALEENKVK